MCVCDVVMSAARGRGDSSAPLDRYADYASDVVGLIQGLALASPVLLGHSMGGMTAAMVASQRGAAIHGVILADPSFLSLERQYEVFERDAIEQYRRHLSLDKQHVLPVAQVKHPHRRPEIVELVTEARLKARTGAFDVLVPPNPDYHQLVSATCVSMLLTIADYGAVSLETAWELQKVNQRLRVERIKTLVTAFPTTTSQSALLRWLDRSYCRWLRRNSDQIVRSGVAAANIYIALRSTAPCSSMAAQCGAQAYSGLENAERRRRGRTAGDQRPSRTGRDCCGR